MRSTWSSDLPKHAHIAEATATNSNSNSNIKQSASLDCGRLTELLVLPTCSHLLDGSDAPNLHASEGRDAERRANPEVALEDLHAHDDGVLHVEHVLLHDLTRREEKRDGPHEKEQEWAVLRLSTTSLSYSFRTWRNLDLTMTNFGVT